MKKLFFLIITIVSFTLTNCSSVKVLDAWKNENVSTVDNNFLVIARTNNKQARLAFENEIAKQMRAKGRKATESYSKFPNFDFEKEITEEKRDKLKEIIKAEGFDGIVLSVVKDMREETQIQEDGGYYAGGFYPSMYPNYYYNTGFYGYYYHPMAYSTYGSYMPSTTTVSTIKTYILETVVYDLEAEKDKQLVAVVTSEVVDPNNMTNIAKEYVYKITKSFEKK